jgi:hypothetical protein
VEEGDGGPLELGAAAGVDGGGAEGLPYDRLAGVGGDEERDARAPAVALLQQLVQQEDDEPGHEELDDDEQADAGADVAGVAVHPGEGVDDGLPDGDRHPEQLLVAAQQLLVVGGAELVVGGAEQADPLGRAGGEDHLLHLLLPGGQPGGAGHGDGSRHQSTAVDVARLGVPAALVISG